MLLLRLQPLLNKVTSRLTTSKISYFTTGKKNPYQVLGVNNNSTIDQIKKAYRKIAQAYHPDKNPDPKAKQIFVNAKNAYEILTDEDKRRQYDNQSSGYGNRGQGFDKNPFDEFNDDIFKDKSRTYQNSSPSGSSRKRKGQNITKQVQLTFVEATKGAHLEVSYEKRGTCSACNGNRCKAGTAPTRCLSCGGSGSTIFRQESIVMHLECSRCKGIGLIIKNPCETCKATGIISQNVTQKIEVPPGVQNHQTITLPQKGNHSENGPNGDLFIKFTVKPHPKFIRRGNDIQSTTWVTISQAALGCKKQIQTLWGNENIKISQGTQDGQKVTINKKGINKGFDLGDHVTIVRIQVPTKLNDKQRKIFQELAKQQSPVEQNITQQFDKDYNPQSNQEKDENTDNVFAKFKDYFK